MNMESTEVYQIKVRGKLNARWSDWFGGMVIVYEVGSDGLPVTTITGSVIDQAALYGVLWKLRDMNLKLISVTPIEMDSKDQVSIACKRRTKKGKGDDEDDEN